MDDEIQLKGNSLFQDKDGNFSSGRVIKIVSGVAALVIAVAGVAILTFLPPADSATLSDYCFKMAGLFLATATGSEIVQKITGR